MIILNSNIFKIDKKHDKNNFFDSSYDKLYEDLLNLELDKQLEFLQKEIRKDMNILDFCCGSGRHMTNLLEKGFNVSGIDINKDSLENIKENYNYKVHKTNLYNYDVRNEKLNLPKFDYIYSIESSIGYSSDNETVKIFKNISKSLSDNGTVMIHLINKDYFIRNFTRRMWFQNNSGDLLLEDRIFNSTDSEINLNQIRIIGKNIKKYSTKLRLYTLKEIEFLMKPAGLKVKNTFGDFDFNSFNINSPYLIIEAVKEVF